MAWSLIIVPIQVYVQKAVEATSLKVKKIRA
jgi:hypothetical protein